MTTNTPATNDLSGLVAVVTGAAAGLGRAEAIGLARAGATVVVNDIASALDTSDVLDEIAAAGSKGVAVAGDISQRATADELVQTADNLGGLGIVVNNAGITRDKMLFNMSDEDWDAVIAVHLRGHFLLTRNAAAYWRAKAKESGGQVYGRIINTSSEAGLSGPIGQANYGAAKAAMLGLVNVLKLEGRRKGVLVNGIAPVAHTRMTDPLLPEEAKPKLGPEQVSPLVAWLASEECDQTGLMLEVAAGLVARVQVTETETVPLAGADGKATDVGAVVRRLTEMPPGDPYPSSDEATSRYVSAAAGG